MHKDDRLGNVEAQLCALERVRLVRDDERRACLEDREDPHHGVEPALQVEVHDLFGLDAQRAQIWWNQAMLGENRCFQYDVRDLQCARWLERSLSSR